MKKNSDKNNEIPASQLSQIRRWIHECENQSRLHELSGRWFRKLEVTSLGVTIGMGAISSVVSMIGDPCTQPHAKILSKTLGLAVSGLASWQGLHRYGERKKDHNDACQKYHELRRKLETELVLWDTSEQSFQTPASIIRYARVQLDRIDAGAPVVPIRFIDHRPRISEDTRSTQVN